MKLERNSAIKFLDLFYFSNTNGHVGGFGKTVLTLTAVAKIY